MGLKELRGRNGRKEGGAPADESGVTTYIDEGCELSGRLRFREAVRIDGAVDGQVRCQKTLVVGESATIKADVEAESVVVRGAVEGDVAARRKITLHESAVVKGELRTAGIVIEEGARFKGSIVIGSDDEAAEEDRPKTAADKRPSNGARPASVNP